MSIKDFVSKYCNTQTVPIKSLVNSWVAEKEARDFLGMKIFGGVTILDAILDSENTTISPEVREAFTNLMGDAANSKDEIVEIFKEKALLGDASIEGLKNKIQGQIGEDFFREAAGASASLAESGSQEGWDVMINRDDFTQYVSVKVYKDPREVLEIMKETNLKIMMGDEGLSGATKIDFAVNSDIYDEVSALATAEGLPNRIYDIGASREDIRSLLDNAQDAALDIHMQDFWQELLGTSMTLAAVHIASQGLLMYMNTKPVNIALEDAAYSTAVSLGGAAAGIATNTLIVAKLETAAGILAGPLGGAAVLAAGISARSILRRFADRRFTAKRLETGNLALIENIKRFSPAG